MTEIAAQEGARVYYRDIKPYDAPAQLTELRGPQSGLLILPHSLYWGPERNIDLDTVGGIVKAYQAIIREGNANDQAQLLSRDRLLEIWPELTLPARARKLWESRFPELVSVA